jgi:hypothetical protein
MKFKEGCHCLAADLFNPGNFFALRLYFQYHYFLLIFGKGAYLQNEIRKKIPFGWRLAFLMLSVAFALCIIVASCRNGQDGEDGRDGEVQEITIDDDGDDDGGGNDDTDDDVDDDDDDGSDDVLHRDDLDYADECPALADCVMDHCSGSADPASYYQVTHCALLNCREDYESCFGPFGEQACAYILKCLQQCLPADCVPDCIDDAGYDATMLFLEAGLCAEANCPSAFEDPLGNVGCFTGACNEPIAECCGGSLLGCM